jgi:coenzyme F420 hydrogenase subunit beta
MTPQVIDYVVNNELCTGCGVCVAACPSNSIDMNWDQYGFLVPNLISDCNNDAKCLEVCPFDPTKRDVLVNEDVLSEMFVKESPNNAAHFIDDITIGNDSKYERKLGNYRGLFAGHSNDYRETSSSGGITSIVLELLLTLDVVDKLIVVSNKDIDQSFYSHRIISTVDEVKETSKTKYHPTTLADCLKEVHRSRERYAVVGLPCFIKGVRKFMVNDEIVGGNIKFCISIVCGGLKSKFYTDYLAQKSGIKHNNYSDPQYREKMPDLKASQYNFVAKDVEEGALKRHPMWTLGDMWGTGLFKANACDFCDDVTGETADISIGDAWIPPYINDGKGANIVITRSELADRVISHAIKEKLVVLENLSFERVIKSQDASFRHRQNAIGFRILLRKILSKKMVPLKRFGLEIMSLDAVLTQLIRMRTRKFSLEVWRQYPDVKVFDRKINRYRQCLKYLSRIKQMRTFYKSDRFRSLMRNLKIG